MNRPRHLTLCLDATDDGQLALRLEEGDQIMAHGTTPWPRLRTDLSRLLTELEAVPKDKIRLDREPEQAPALEPPKDLRPVLRLLGRRLWDELLPDAVRDALGQAVSQASARQPLALALAIDDACPWLQELMRLPWAALWPGEGLPLGLRPHLALWHRVTAKGPAPEELPAPPLRLIFAVSLPEAASNLDYEGEEALILKAFLDQESASFFGSSGPRPFIAPVDEGDLESIVRATDQSRAQVLHLSGHGRQGELRFEDRDGNESPTSGSELARALAECTNLRLVVLNECQSGSPGPPPADDRLRSVAAEVARSVSPALGMIWNVFDSVASDWAYLFYRGLAELEWQPLWALARARLGLAKLLDESFAQGRPIGHGTEWACPVLFAATPPGPLFDPDRKPDRPSVKPAPSVRDWPAAREVGSFIGRQSERRELLRVLLGDPERHRPPARMAILRGLGGVGKSALAAKLVESLARRGYRVAIHFGRASAFELLPILSDLVLKAGGAGEVELSPSQRRKLATLAKGDAPLDPGEELVPLSEAQGLLEPLLAGLRFCLVLDDFEQNLNLPQVLREGRSEEILPLLPSASYGLDSKELAQFLVWLLRTASTGKVLVTCRYGFELPESRDLAIAQPMLRGLPEGDALKLTLRLRGFEGLTWVQRRECVASLGGHPRALEFLDVLLRRPRGAEEWLGVGPRVQEQVEAWIKAGRLDLSQSPDPEQVRQQALVLAADDIMLGELVQELNRREGPKAVALLRRLSVFRQPFGPVAPRKLLEPAWLHGEPNPEHTLKRWLQVMEELGLLHREAQGGPPPDKGPRWLVPELAARLLASIVRPVQDQEAIQSEQREAHRRAAAYYRFLEKTSGHTTFSRLVERRYHLIEGEEWDEAVEVTKQLGARLELMGAFHLGKQIVEEVLNLSPSNSIPQPDRIRLDIINVRCRKVLEGAKAVLPLASSLMLEALGLEQEPRDVPNEPAQVLQEQGERLIMEDLPAALHRVRERHAEQGDQILDVIGSVAYDFAFLIGELGEVRLQREILEELAPIYEALDRFGELSNIQYQLASFYTFAHNNSKARDLLAASNEHKNRIGDRRGLAANNLLLARIAINGQKHNEARQLVAQSLERYDEIGDAQGQIASHLLFAQIELDQDNYSQAREHLAHSQEIADETGDRKGKATALYLLAIMAERQDSYPDAVKLLEQSIPIREEIGDRMGKAGSLAQLGTWKLERGDFDGARKLLQEAAEIFAELGEGAEHDRARILIYLGRIQSLEQPSVGLRMARQGVDQLRQMGHHSAIQEQAGFEPFSDAVYAAVRAARAEKDSADLAYEEGACALLAGAPEEAEEPLRQALAEFQKRNQERQSVQADWALSHALAATGQDEEAAERAATAKAKARKLNMELPWFPGPGQSDVGEQQRRRVRRLLLDAVESAVRDPQQAMASLGEAVEVLRRLPDPPQDQAELLIKGMFQTGGLGALGLLSPWLVMLLAQDQATQTLAEALQEELKHTVAVVLPQIAQHPDQEARARGHFGLAQILASVGDLKGAREQAQQSLELNQKLGLSEGIEECKAVLAQLEEAG
jgi:tetratricopeptide (TPR) repeat protein